MRRRFKGPTGRTVGLLVLFCAVWAVWDSPVVYPLRILVTFFHEIGHGLGAVLSGGGIQEIVVRPDGSGMCRVTGGWPLVYLPAGYLGSMIFGSTLILAAARTRRAGAVAEALGVFLFGICLFFVKGWAFWYGSAIGLALLAAGMRLSEDINDIILSFIGITSCLYALVDIRYLFRLGGGYNDAGMFSQQVFPLPPRFWALCWGLLSLVCLYYTLRLAAPGKRR